MGKWQCRHPSALQERNFKGGNDANFFATKEEEGRATERTKEEQSSIWRSHGAGGIRKKAKQPIKINKPTPEE